MQTEIRTLAINEIRIDGGTQPRAGIDEDAVREYAAAMEGGAEFPPVIVFHDGKHYWLADGFHRYHAHVRIDQLDIKADVRPGTRSNALWFGIEANRTQGLRFTNADKQEAVRLVLADPELSKHSDQEIAKHVGVDPKTVAKQRSISGNSRDATAVRTVTRGGKTFTMNVANIGRKKAAAPPPPPEPDEIESFDEPAPEPEQPKREPTDETGKVIPERMRADFTKGRDWLKRLMANIQVIRRDAKTLSESGAGAYLTMQKIDLDLKNAWVALKFALPYAVCPYCKGTLKTRSGEKCKACRNQGWINQDIYENAPKNLK